VQKILGNYCKSAKQIASNAFIEFIFYQDEFILENFWSKYLENSVFEFILILQEIQLVCPMPNHNT